MKTYLPGCSPSCSPGCSPRLPLDLGGHVSPHPLMVENIIASGIWGALCLCALLLLRIPLRAASGVPMFPHPLNAENIIVSGIWAPYVCAPSYQREISLLAASGGTLLGSVVVPATTGAY